MAGQAAVVVVAAQVEDTGAYVFAHARAGGDALFAAGRDLGASRHGAQLSHLRDASLAYPADLVAALGADGLGALGLVVLAAVAVRGAQLVAPTCATVDRATAAVFAAGTGRLIGTLDEGPAARAALDEVAQRAADGPVGALDVRRAGGGATVSSSALRWRRHAHATAVGTLWGIAAVARNVDADQTVRTLDAREAAAERGRLAGSTRVGKVRHARAHLARGALDVGDAAAKLTLAFAEFAAIFVGSKAVLAEQLAQLRLAATLVVATCVVDLADLPGVAAAVAKVDARVVAPAVAGTFAATGVGPVGKLAAADHVSFAQAATLGVAAARGRPAVRNGAGASQRGGNKEEGGQEPGHGATLCRECAYRVRVFTGASGRGRMATRPKWRQQ